MPFTPARDPDPQLGRLTRAGVENFTRAVDFFWLFFTAQVVDDICRNTNIYGWLHVLDKQTYRNTAGGWDEISPDEFYAFIALIIYMGIVQVWIFPHVK